MDPNPLLESIRETLRLYFDGSLESSEAAYDLAEDIANLDEWLSKGGFLPNDWQWTTDDRVSIAGSLIERAGEVEL